MSRPSIVPINVAAAGSSSPSLQPLLNSHSHRHNSNMIGTPGSDTTSISIPDTPIVKSPDAADDAYKRKRMFRGSNREDDAGNTNGRHSNTHSDDDDDHDLPYDEDEEEEAPLKGWPTPLQLQRRITLSWRMLRLSTVVKFFLLLVTVILVVRFLVHQIKDWKKATNFTVVAVVKDMHHTNNGAISTSSSSSSTTSTSDTFQSLSLLSWARHVRGDHILVFVEREETCFYLEDQVRGIQCFVIPKNECVHTTLKKPRLDCIFSIAHANAPTDTIVYVNNDALLIDDDLASTISMVQQKYDRFVMTGRRTDIPVTDEMLQEYSSGKTTQDYFVEKLIHTARVSGKLHAPDQIDLIVYQRQEFQKNHAFQPFPPLLAGAAFWDAWFLSHAILDDRVTSIDISSSVLIVHLDYKSLTTSSSTTTSSPHRLRQGSSYNEELISSLSGNTWKVGTNLENMQLMMKGDCRKGGVVVASGSTTTAATPTTTQQRTNQLELINPHLTSLSSITSPGCFVLPHPSRTDLVLFTRHASSTGVITIVPVNSDTIELALNWLCSVERIDFTSFVMIVEDRSSLKKLQTRHASRSREGRAIPILLLEENLPETAHTPPPATLESHARSLLYIAHSKRILSSGFHFLWNDLEESVVWMDDPGKFLTNADVQGRNAGRVGWRTEVERRRNQNASFITPSLPIGLSSYTSITPADSSLTSSFLSVRSTTNGRYYWNKLEDCVLRSWKYQKVWETKESIDGIVLPEEYDPKEYTIDYCLNTIQMQLSLESSFLTSYLDPFLFPSGRAFFEMHTSQLHGIIPVVVAIPSVQEEEEMMKEEERLQQQQSPVLAAASATPSSRIQLLKEWSLFSIDPDTEECLAAPHDIGSTTTAVASNLLLSSSGKDSSSSSLSPFHLKIRVLTYNRPDSLLRLLTSLASADYTTRTTPIKLEISIDDPTPSPDEDELTKWHEVVEIAKKFEWKEGEKVVIEQEHNIGLVGQWLTGWNPSEDEKEVCLFLEDDTEVSPAYYLWLKKATETYYYSAKNYDPRLYGISLMKQEKILGETYRTRYGSHTPGDYLTKYITSGQINAESKYLYRYQLLGTSGALFFPQHWRSFMMWLQQKHVDSILGLSSSYTPCVPTIVSNSWWIKQSHKTWIQWFVKFTEQTGWYSLYTNFPPGALVVNHREVGLNYGITKGSQVKLLGGPCEGCRSDDVSTSQIPSSYLTFPSTHLIPLFDFHFNRITHPSVLSWRKALTNEKFLNVESMTNTKKRKLPYTQAALENQTPEYINQQCWSIDSLQQQYRYEREIKLQAQDDARRIELLQEEMRAAEKSAAEVAAQLKAAAKKNGTAAAKGATGAKGKSASTGADKSKKDSKAGSSTGAKKDKDASAAKKSSTGAASAKKSSTGADSKKSDAKSKEKAAATSTAAADKKAADKKKADSAKKDKEKAKTDDKKTAEKAK